MNEEDQERNNHCGMKHTILIGIVFFALLLLSLPVQAQSGDDEKRIILVSTTAVVRSPADQQFLETIVSVVNRHEEFLGVEAVQEGMAPASGNFMEADNNLEPEFVIVGDRSPGTNNQNTYTLILIDLKTGSAVSTEQLYYRIVQDITLYYLTNIVERMLALIPAIPHFPDIEQADWKSRWIYPYARVGGAFKWYQIEYLSATITWEAAAGVDFQFVSWEEGTYGLSAGAEVFFTQDMLSYYPNVNSDLVRQVSFTSFNALGLIKGNYNPRQFILSAGGGVTLAFPIAGESKIYGPPLGWAAVLEGGVKVKESIVSLHFRLAGDFYEFHINDIKYTRLAAVTLGISYKAGFGKRPQKIISEMMWEQ
ncbi:MAG: hypothetical protein LBR23_02830 [Spirochaetaceae bacterium]|nr:hypothetical protein [Spirochaetaceae bacterium]